MSKWLLKRLALWVGIATLFGFVIGGWAGAVWLFAGSCLGVAIGLEIARLKGAKGSERRRSVVVLVLLLLGSLMLFTACAGAEAGEESPLPQQVENSVYLGKLGRTNSVYRFQDGNTTCYVLDGYNAGNIICDWGRGR